VEAAWAYQYMAKVSGLIARGRPTCQGCAGHRLEGTSAAVCPVSPSGARGVSRNKIVVAIARELAGFVWAIGQKVKPI
jgi:hypothetical protein